MITNDTETYVLHDQPYVNGTVAYGFPISKLPTAPNGMGIASTVLLVTGSPIIRYEDGFISGKNIRRVRGEDLALMTKNFRLPEILSYSYYKRRNKRATNTKTMKSRNKGFDVSTYRITSAMEYEDRAIKEDYGVSVGGFRKKKHPYSYYDDYTHDLRSTKGLSWKNQKVNRQWKRASKEDKTTRIKNKWQQPLIEF